MLMSMQGEKTKQLFERAKAVIPHGVNSNFRYWGDDDTLVIERGEGAYIWDADGNRYIDYRLAFGPIILGHSYPAVVARVQEAIQYGTLFAWTTPLEISVCERLTRMCNVDKVRLTNTGTEACMHAIRIARAYTAREKFIKFEGAYHGMTDYFLFSTASSNLGAMGSARSPVNAPVTSGIPKGMNEYVINLPFNDFERLEETVHAKWGDIAAIFIEPMLGNAAGIMPKAGFLEKIRELCDKYGIVMVLDEVKTGFRIANGGAQEIFGIQADLVTFAKSMGNGFPVAAIAGKEDVMMTVEPGRMAHGGTYTGNVVATAAADATLEILENEPVLETVRQRGQSLMDGIDEILTEADIPHAITGLPAMFGYQLGSSQKPHDFRAYLGGDAALYEDLGMELIKRGVQPDSDGREPWFLCYALSQADVDETLNVFNDSVKAIKK
jgi:glutamate-1-semialdehyde 2,1-aminomutase